MTPGASAPGLYLSTGAVKNWQPPFFALDGDLALCRYPAHCELPDMSVENILVVRRSLFDDLGAFQGFLDDSDRYLHAFFKPGNAFFVPRPDAEQDPSLKQLIPYCVFTHGGRILRYTRGGSGGEKRLSAKMSIGIGGHVNDTDAAGGDFGAIGYATSVRREIDEELRLTGSYSDRIVGLINDDSNDVGRVHLGVVHLVELESAAVTPGEAAIADLTFVTLETVITEQDRLETWSQIVAAAVGSLGVLDTKI